MKYKIDHDLHIHSKLSVCSQDELQTKENILKYAIQNNLKQICLTDHFWDENVPGASGWYKSQNYEHLACALPLPHDETVEFLFGCETELDKHFNIGISDKVFDKFDFVIIPTTHLHMMTFTIDPVQDSIEGRAEIYVKRFNAVLEKDIPFEKVGIAHLTCPLLAPHNPHDHIDVLNLIDDKTFNELFSKASKLGVGIELNFPINKYSGKDLDDILRPYKIAKKCGCKFYMGSDAHHPKDFDGICKGFECMIDSLDLTEDDKFFIPKCY